MLAALMSLSLVMVACGGDDDAAEETASSSSSSEEVEIHVDENTPSIQLKEKHEIYMELYQAALEKANRAKEYAIQHFLEAKKIKNTYLLPTLQK